jgi:chromate transporter
MDSATPAAQAGHCMPNPTPAQLFLGFLQIGGLAFGGAVAWARQVLVESRGWLDDRRYAELLGLAQVLPGPNIGNFAVIYGRQCAGFAGAAAALGGFFLLPLCVVISLVLIWQEFGQNAWVNAFMQGVAAAAAGMALGTALKSGTKVRPPPEQIAAVLAICAAAAIWRIPLPWILLVAVPVCVAMSLRRAWRA